MVKMHRMTALIALAGDMQNVAHRTSSDPVSYPEIAVLQEVHGENAVVEFQIIDDVDTTPAAEKARLLSRYGAVVETVYPGRNPQMDFTDPTVADQKAETIDDVKNDTPAKADADPFAKPAK